MTFHTLLFPVASSITTKEKGAREGKILKVLLCVCHTCYVHICPPLILMWQPWRCAAQIFLQESISFNFENLQDRLQHSSQGHLLLRQPQPMTEHGRGTRAWPFLSNIGFPLMSDVYSRAPHWIGQYLSRSASWPEALYAHPAFSPFIFHWR